MSSTVNITVACLSFKFVLISSYKEGADCQKFVIFKDCSKQTHLSIISFPLPTHGSRITSFPQFNTVIPMPNGIPKLRNSNILIIFGGTRRAPELFSVGTTEIFFFPLLFPLFL
jgi:hypothetical protein